MTGLIDLSDEIKKIYDSDSEDISEILNKTLKKSRRYSRIGSYFSSKSFISLAEGLGDFFIKNGKMKLIINYELGREDYDELKKTIDYQKIEDKIKLDIQNLKSEMELNSAKVLAWLIWEKKLEIRVVVGGCDNNLMHIKQGVLEDELGNKLAFTGSANETYSAYESNIEQITFFKNWIKGQEDYVDEFLFKFSRFWNNCGAEARTYSLSKAFERGLIHIRPKSEKELKISLSVISGDNKKEFPKSVLIPRPYQLKALSSWVDNGKRGIVEMPTGCGKTKTAIFCYREVQKEGPNITTIFAPTKAICNQWLEEFKNESCSVCKIYDNSKWKSDVKKEIIDLRLETKNHIVIIGSYALMNSDYLINQIRSVKNINKLLIADEAHSTGAQKTSKGLIEDYNYRLALSATPKRYLDDDGTNKIFEYFGDVIFNEISLYDAIYNLEVLSEYDYYLIHVVLNEEELESYLRITKQIIQKMEKKKMDQYNSSLDSEIQRLAEKRAKIIKNCNSKIDKFKNIIGEIKDDKSIIFVSPEQREKIIELVRDKVRYHQYTYSENSEIRSKALENFKNGAIKCLVAIKCLDEGLDVPSANVGVILASSGNPREFIQRRGRLLRKHPSKKYAKIYDFFVTPTKEAIDSSETYKSQVSKELARITEFAKSARNELQLSKELKELKISLGI